MENTYEMLPQQKAIWNIEMTYPDTDICNIGGYLHLEGKYDIALLKNTLDIFLKNHSSFWMKINRKGRIYFDKIEGTNIEEYDLRDFTDEEVDERINQWMYQPFSLYDTYLFDFRLVRLRDKVIIYEKYHHLIADGFAVSLCARVQESIYEQLEEGRTDFEPDERLLREITQKRPETMKVLKEADAETSFSTFRKKAVTPKAEIISGYITGDCEENTQQECKIWKERKFEYKELMGFCRKYRVSVESLFYGCLGVYLCRLYNGDGLIIGRNLLNRSGEDMSVIAMKVDTLNVAVIPQWDETAAVYMAQLKKQMAVQAASGTSMKAREEIEISYRPLRYLPAPKHGECREYYSSSLEIPLKLFINDTGKAIELVIKYQSEVFTEEEVQRLWRKLMYFIQQILENPDIRLKDIRILEESEISHMELLGSSKSWNYTTSLQERCLEAVRKFPEKTAMIYKGRRYSYRESFAMINRIRQLICTKAMPEREKVAALCLTRSPWLPVSIYAAWLSGYSFLPVSPKESPERKKKIAEKCAFFLTDSMIEEYKEDDFEGELKLDLSNPEAYRMFTSGTTGSPKTVRISHKSLCCRLEWMRDEFEGGTDVILQKTRSTFDVSVWELVFPFAFSKTMCILEDGKEMRPDIIGEELLKNHVTMVHFVPSMLSEFLIYVEKSKLEFPSLKYIILSGEALGAHHVKAMRRLIPNAAIYNLYGPAECTIDVSYYRCVGDESIIPIGRAVNNTRLTVRNSRDEIIPMGEVGELVVEGDLVGMGYADENESSGYGEIAGKLVYHTGDLAFWGDDGFLYYEGRIDHQVKVRGMRVNLTEIEQTLSQAIDETQHIVLYLEERLIDFYQGETGEEEMRREAVKVLPYYCVPSEFVKLDRIPTGNHGKADRKKLKSIYEERLKETVKEQDFSKDWEVRGREELLLGLAVKVLKRVDIGLDSNLLDKGMDSLTVLSYLDECEQHGIYIRHEELYSCPCVRQLAKAERVSDPLVFSKKEGREKLVLMVPFAGGSPVSCWKLSGELKEQQTDVGVVNLPVFRGSTVEDAAKAITKGGALKDYKEIYIMGDCVGSGLAIELSDRLADRLKGFMLCEALPYEGVRILNRELSIWDMMPDAMLTRFLQRLRDKKFEMSEEQIACFRSDVARSMAYFRKKKRVRLHCPVTMVFGEEDSITSGYKKRYVKWRKWLPMAYKVYTICKGRHFMMEDNPGRIAAIMKKEWFQTR